VVRGVLVGGDQQEMIIVTPEDEGGLKYMVVDNPTDEWIIGNVVTMTPADAELLERVFKMKLEPLWP
jgi:hypothetical protein